MSLSGALTTLYSFCAGGNPCTDGETPLAGLVQAANGEFYGTTPSGANPGPYGTGAGTVFKITPRGTLTTLYSFCSQGGTNCTDGANPYAGLIQATDGEFYGTTTGGGANGDGVVFKIAPNGTLTTLYSFCSQGYPRCTDGDFPDAGRVQATNGDFYGTTYSGGANNSGTVFRMSPSGALTTLYSFAGTDGRDPHAGLVQATNGDLYGTTLDGGANCVPDGCGTIFKIAPSGTLTTLYTFCAQSGCADGEILYAGLVQATNGDFYGTASAGGANGYE
jgi:uncharacterized repeat protein (TIGR03803 family)